MEAEKTLTECGKKMKKVEILSKKNSAGYALFA